MEMKVIVEEDIETEVAKILTEKIKTLNRKKIR